MKLKRIFVVIFIGWVLIHADALAQAPVPLPAQEDTSTWPGQKWEKAKLPQQIIDKIEPMIADAMNRDLSDVMGETRSVVIIYRGQLVLERYRDGFGPDTKQISWSMAKSFTSALVGRALDMGWIKSIDQPMPGPWDAPDPRAKITWRQWLNMTDGLKYSEIGEADLTKNDVVQMMFGRGRFDTNAYVRQLPLAHSPGEHWNYSSAAYHMIGRALQTLIAKHAKSENINAKDMVNFANKQLFLPIGMDAQIEFDPAGTYMGGSLIWASATDFARFGYLFLRDGIWGRQRLMPKGWVEFAHTQTPAQNANIYGAGWWIQPNDPANIRPAGKASALPPQDSFSAQGHEGQTIWVVPSRDLVIVRLGLMGPDPQNWPELFDWNQRLAMAFPLVGE